MYDRFISQVAIASVLPFMLFLVSPLTFYFGNTTEINFLLSDIVWPVLGIFLGFSVVIFLMLLAFSAKAKKLQKIVAGLLVGVAGSIWVQSQIFVWRFGPLDGRGIDWDRWSAQMWLEGVVWSIIILVAIYLFASKKDKMIKVFLQLLFFIGMISIASIYIMSTAKPFTKAIDQGKELETAFEFHSKNNVIVILLDTFQSDYFELISKEYQDETKFLDGFIFYRNTMSQYPTTAPNIPAIMTRKVYKNEEKFKDFKKEAFSGFDFRKTYTSRGYSTRSIVAAGVIPDIITMKETLDYFSISSTIPWREFLDYGFFRGSPTFFKYKIYNDGNWLMAFWGRAKYPPDFHGVDVRFLELFEKQAFVGSDLDNKLGTFTFFHFYIPHPPWRVDEKLQYNSGLSGRDGYIHQARGALMLARRMIEKLKEMDIYDSAEIVIMSDHGTSSVPLVNKLASTSIQGNIPSKVRSSALALFLYKKPFSKGELVLDDSSLMHSDIACLLGVQTEYQDCAEFQSAVKGIQRIRKYLFYDWKHEYWQADYMPVMAEYIVDGHAYNEQAWRIGEYQYEPEKKIEQTDTYKNKPEKKIKQADKNTYVIGLPVSFANYGNSNNFILNGWSGQEERHRWTEGTRSALSFKLNEKILSNLIFRLRGSGFNIPGKVDQQLVNVVVNDQQVAQWTMRGEQWFQAIIPASLVNSDGLVNIVFNISNPAAPADFGNSIDSRKLGMMVKEVVIELTH